MFLLPDPDELCAIADRIAGHAQAARAAASRVRHALAATHWTGFAADAFDVQAGSVIFALHSTAGRLDDTADAMRAHAANVARLVALIRRLGGDGVDLGSALGSGLLDEALHPGDLAGDTVDVLGSAGRAVGDVGHLLGIG